jgi:hypothetical protein
MAMAVANLERRAKAGASNFYWIAGLSVLNSVISAFNGGVAFVVGLGITQFVDAIAGIAAEQAPEITLVIRVAGLAVSVVMAGVFVVFGFFGARQHRWAFITGMVLYGLDALLLLFFKDWLGFGFHLYFMWGLFNGLKALDQLRKIKPAQTIPVSDFPQDIGG